MFSNNIPVYYKINIGSIFKFVFQLNVVSSNRNKKREIKFFFINFSTFMNVHNSYKKFNTLMLKIIKTLYTIAIQ